MPGNVVDDKSDQFCHASDNWEEASSGRSSSDRHTTTQIGQLTLWKLHGMKREDSRFAEFKEKA